MSPKIILFALLICTVKLFSQDSKLSFEANFPIPVGDNFFGENYKGIIDIGGKYKFLDFKIIDVGVGVNSSVSSSNQQFINSNVTAYKITVFSLQPKLYLKLDLPIISKIHPILGLGYSFLIFNTSETLNGNQLLGQSDTQSGINLNFGITYDISSKFFAQIQYDFIKLKVDELPDISYNTNVNILKIGLGYKL